MKKSHNDGNTCAYGFLISPQRHHIRVICIHYEPIHIKFNIHYCATNHVDNSLAYPFPHQIKIKLVFENENKSIFCIHDDKKTEKTKNKWNKKLI